MTKAVAPSVCANSHARFRAVNVLPSPMPALVITNARLPSRSPACNTCVRKERNCSHSAERGLVIATRCGSTRAAEISREENSAARVDPTAPKVAPASRKAGPPGSAGPPVASVVCAVDADSKVGGAPVNALRSHGWSYPFPEKFGYDTLPELPFGWIEVGVWRGADS